MGDGGWAGAPLDTLPHRSILSRHSHVRWEDPHARISRAHCRSISTTNCHGIAYGVSGIELRAVWNCYLRVNQDLSSETESDLSVYVR